MTGAAGVRTVEGHSAEQRAISRPGAQAMTTRHVTALDHSIEKANIWINEMAEALGTEDRQAAYRALRGFLHALRDRIPVDETAQLAAQLPELVRGVYYENWRPSTTPRSYHSPSSSSRPSPTRRCWPAPPRRRTR